MSIVFALEIYVAMSMLYRILPHVQIMGAYWLVSDSASVTKRPLPNAMESFIAA